MPNSRMALAAVGAILCSRLVQIAAVRSETWKVLQVNPPEKESCQVCEHRAEGQHGGRQHGGDFILKWKPNSVNPPETNFFMTPNRCEDGREVGVNAYISIWAFLQPFFFCFVSENLFCRSLLMWLLEQRHSHPVRRFWAGDLSNFRYRPTFRLPGPSQQFLHVGLSGAPWASTTAKDCSRSAPMWRILQNLLVQAVLLISNGSEIL